MTRASTLFVFEQGQVTYRWLTLECNVRILDGPDAPDLNIKLFRVMQEGIVAPGKLNWFGQEKTEEEFRQAMIDEGRLIYEFEVLRAYGMYGGLT